MDCRSGVLRFSCTNEKGLVWEGYNTSRANPLISNLKANNRMYKGLLFHIVIVNDLDHDIPSIDSVLAVSEFEMYFLMISLEFIPLRRLTLVST